MASTRSAVSVSRAARRARVSRMAAFTSAVDDGVPRPPVHDLIAGLELQPFKGLTEALSSLLQAQLGLAKCADEKASG